VLGLAALIPSAAHAVEYALEPAVDLQAVYNDNIYMTNAPHDSVTGAIFAPRLNFAARMETWQLGAEARFRDVRYHGIEGLDTTDRIVNLNSRYHTERNALQLSGGRAKESILTSTFIDADTGLARTQVIRTSDSATAAWAWSLTEQSQIKLNYQYTDVTYDTVSTSNLYDYSQRGPSATLSHSLSEKAQLFLLADNKQFSVPKWGTSHLGLPIDELDFGSYYLFDRNPREVSKNSSTNTIQAGINYAVSETMTGNLVVGTHKTTMDTLSDACTAASGPTSTGTGICHAVATTTVTTTSRGKVYNVNLTKKTETLQLNATALRTIDPSGSGTQVQNDTLRLTARWSKTERLTFSLSALNSKLRAIDNTSAVVDRNIYNIVPSVEWRIRRNSTVNLSYGYSHLSYLGATDSISSQQVKLSYSYAWDRISISH
jgi:hypothetical protein